MLGDWVDEYTVKVMDVFAMPQRGTSMSVEAVDEGYQIEMMDMLKPTGRGEVVVGWYHSHPGWDVWLSSVDQATQEVSAASPSQRGGTGAQGERCLRRLLHGGRAPPPPPRPQPSLPAPSCEWSPTLASSPLLPPPALCAVF